MELKRIYKIEGDLKCITGLHIGAGDSEMHIGGVDSEIVRNPSDNMPYIPGSSLKGKIRTLMEWRTGKVGKGPLGYGDLKGNEKEKESVLMILRLFGVSGDAQVPVETMKKIGPARLSFWDCPISEESKKEYDESLLGPVEVKTENSIDRIRGSVSEAGVRYIERVPAGATFDFALTVRIFEDDDEKEILSEVLAGLTLLQMDALGGSGSRGYGKVKLDNLTIAEAREEIKLTLRKTDEKSKENEDSSTDNQA